ncbi:MAG TPA: HAMP domain-containing protein [Gammaproteobacteria bacterium]|nr:HAMP domain-containing protein [Gammaproteobacteria bacterium]
MARITPIRRSLLGGFLLVVILLGGTILVITVVGSRQAIHTFSQSLMAQTIDHVEGEISRFISPAIRELQLARSWGRGGVLDITDTEELNRLFMPLIRQHPQVSSLMMADESGREYMLLRGRDGWRNRITRREEWGERTLWQEWASIDDPPQVRWRDQDYDPRQRPWFRGAMARLALHGGTALPGDGDELIHWTEPYTFFTTGDPGITASIAFQGADGMRYVVGFDILLRDISDFTARLKVRKHGTVTVLTDDGRVIGLPAIDRFRNPAERQRALLRSPLELGVTVVADAARALTETAEHIHLPQKFTSDGEVWWGQARHFPLTAERYLVIAVMVPSSDMLDGLAQIRVGVVVTTAGVLVLAILLAFLLARRYSQPIEALVQQIDSISRGDLDSEHHVDSRVTEIKQLTDAHNRMRSSLRSLLKLERDLQLARQIQQKTFPARVPDLEGISIVAWSEPAEETGGDTYDIIGIRRQHADGALELSEEQADQVILLLADVTGHGIGPALTAMEVRAMLRMAVRLGMGIDEIALHMNEQLCADLHAGRFITAWIGDLDVASRTLTSFSAGQAPLLHYRAAEGRFEILEADTPPLGISSALPVGAEMRIRLDRGDIFAVISDGVFEAKDEEGHPFGVTGVTGVLQAQCRATPRVMLEALRAAIAGHTRGLAAQDDRTVIIVKRDG